MTITLSGFFTRVSCLHVRSRVPKTADVHQQEVAILVSFLFTMSGKIDKLKKIFMSVLDRKTVHFYVKINVHFKAPSQFIFPFPF